MRILGTSVEAIDACEDRKKFSRLCDTWDARGLWHGGPPQEIWGHTAYLSEGCVVYCCLLFVMQTANRKLLRFSLEFV